MLRLPLFGRLKMLTVVRNRGAAVFVALAVAAPALHGQQAGGQYDAILTSAYPPNAPGAAALVARGSEILFLGASGMADIELDVPLGADMVFEIGSVTKQFTATAIMMLAEEGKLAVSDPITKHLPDYPAYGGGITIEHLLTHTSGIVSYTSIPGYMSTTVKQDVSVKQLIDVFASLPVEFAPGEHLAYNNSGYILLGAIIEAASGMSYEDFVRQRIFEALGMDRSYYGSNMRIIPGRVRGYGPGDGGFSNQQYLSFTQPYAAGSLMMNVEDWYRWSRALFGGRVVNAASLERMTTPYKLKNGDVTDYGYGLSIAEVRGHRAIRHGGGIFGFATDGLYLPEQDVYVAVFSNNAASEIAPALVGTRLAALAIGQPFDVFVAIDVPEAVLRRYVGVYQIDDEMQRTVTVRDGALYTQRTGGRLSRAYPSRETHFFYKTSNSHFEFVVQNGEVTGMRTYPEGGPETEYAVRVSSDISTREYVTVGRAVLEGYVGVYEVRPGFYLTISLDGDRVVVQPTGQASFEMLPESETRFVVDVLDATLEFVVGADGRAREVMVRQAGQVITAKRKP